MKMIQRSLLVKRYFQHTKHLPLIICTDGNSIRIWIDVSHADHADMIGHVGLYASIRKGDVMTSANIFKLNTLSSTETEIVGAGEKLPKCIWF